MTTEERCEEVRDLIPELAVGAASGDERARALQHLARCPECRRELELMSEVADELLMLAPEREPPIGFESRVLARLISGRRKGWRMVALGAAAALVLAAISAGVVYRTGARDRVLAAQYEDVLSRFDGEYFESAPLEGSRSGAEGQVFAYQGSPSWLFVIAPGQPRRESYTITLETQTGRRIGLGTIRVTAEGGSWGKTIPVPLSEVARLRLEDGEGHALEARFPRWSAD